MSLSMYQVSVPVFRNQLNALCSVLAKAEEHAEARKLDPLALTQCRLYPDMFTLARQVQIASDSAKGAVARLAGVEVPVYPDVETTLEQLKERCARTEKYIAGFTAEQIDGSEEREIDLPMRAGSMTFKGQQYLLGFALPNFYFHVTTAYAILRHCGVEIGKRDFLGTV
ncbi:MAG: hypothetical protein JWM91_2966 [Rhodospirillales bacterium]|nr:hypothetical protein [Rhodospirillales bacterium]